MWVTYEQHSTREKKVIFCCSVFKTLFTPSERCFFFEILKPQKKEEMTLRIQMLRYRGAVNQIVLPKKWAIDLIFYI